MNKGNIKVIVVNDNNVKDTDKFLEVLVNHMLHLKSGVKLKGTFTKPKVVAVDDDEEFRTAKIRQFEILNDFLGTVQNKRKVRGLKLNTPKAVKCFFQQQRDELYKNSGKAGEIVSFIMNLIDAELFANTKQNLLPTPEHMTEDTQVMRLNILRAMQNKVFNENVMPSELDPEGIVEIVLKKNQNLAKKEDLIRIARNILRLE
jgi:urease gamma subunit